MIPMRAGWQRWDNDYSRSKVHMRKSFLFDRAQKDALLRQYGLQRTPSQQQQGRQLFNDGPYIDAPTAAIGALSSTSIEDCWPGITWTPIFANDAKAGKIYCVRAGGTISLTGGTGIITPQWGPAGTTLGVSLTQGTVTIAITAWYLAFDLLVQSVGAAGANSKVIGTGFLHMGGG